MWDVVQCDVVKSNYYKLIIRLKHEQISCWLRKEKRKVKRPLISGGHRYTSRPLHPVIEVGSVDFLISIVLVFVYSDEPT